MTDQERYEQFDLPFYREHIAPILPPRVLDFHTHVYLPEHRLTISPQVEGATYMVSEDTYSIEMLADDGKRLFPDRPYHAVCFGTPGPKGAHKENNRYAAGATKTPGMYPLLMTGRETYTPEEIEQLVREDGFFGYKVMINWLGDDYGSVRLEDMLGPAEMDVANRLGLVVLWHVPRSERLADPDVQQGVRDYSQRYPNARIVLAHCGRCYLPDEAKAAIHTIKDLPNVTLDASMVMDPTALEIVLSELGPSRLVFATDLPIAIMRGRRVYVADHWVDLVYEDYQPSAYRVLSNNMRATFMVYEIVLAIRRAADRVGLTAEEQAAIYYDNGMALLNGVMDGEQMKKVAK